MAKALVGDLSKRLAMFRPRGPVQRGLNRPSASNVAHVTSEIVLFGIGSSLTPDFEESVRRSGFMLRAGIKNRDGPIYVLNGSTVIDICEMPEELSGLPYLLPMFTPGHRQAAMREAQSIGFTEPFALVDASVVRPVSLIIGAGVFVNVGTVLGGECTFGDFVLINRGACIGHHAQISAFASIGPGVVLAGQVTIGTGAVVGAGAVVLPKVSIGSNSVVGAGAVVTRDVPPHTVVAGNPARVINSEVPGYNGICVTY
jgi:sugar O-acyltransferase (sialic acid O-acetyltransferase NeuD family)